MFLVGLVGFWALFGLLHWTCGRLSPHKYRTYLERKGIKIAAFSISFKTSRFSRYFYRIGRLSPAFWRIWFTFGVIVGCILLALGPVFLVINAWSLTRALVVGTEAGTDNGLALSATSIQPLASVQPGHTMSAGNRSGGGGGGGDSMDASAHGQDDTGQVAKSEHAAVASFADPQRLQMTPIIPGVNVPLNHLVFIFLVLIVNAVFHEGGHAVAGAIHEVFIESSGAFLQLIYPGAFVELHTPHLDALKPFQQLRIYCAGVFHNMVICLVAVLLLLCFPAWITLSSYVRGEGVAIINVHPQSPLHSALVKGDVIYKLNEECAVLTKADFSKCFDSFVAQKEQGRTGYCMPRKLLGKFPDLFPPEESLHDCCASQTGESSESSLCFESEDHMHKCIPVRRALAQADLLATRRCSTDGDCPVATECWKADVEADESTFIFEISVRDKENVLFLGPIDEFVMSLAVSDYVPTDGGNRVMLPIYIETFLQYLQMLSPALAFINMLPCFYLDGAFALGAVLELMFPQPSFDTDRVTVLKNYILAAHTLLLIYVVLLSFINTLVVEPATHHHNTNALQPP